MRTDRWHRLLLPGELRDGSGGRSARDWVVDVAFYAIATGVGVGVLVDTADQHGPALLVIDIVLGVATFVVLAWRRGRPGVVGVVLAAASVVSSLAAGPALVATFNVALRGSRRAILLVAGLSAVSVAVTPRLYPPSDGYLLNLLVGVLLIAVVFGWGLFVRVGREHSRSLQERAERLETEQQQRAEQAREAERRRIAREMHDVLAHRVSLLSLHAGALEFRPDAPPAEIAAAAGVIRSAAHATLEDLRAVIGVLRGNSGAGAGTGVEPERPQPTLADVPALVEESRAAGMKVTCRCDVSDDVPATLGRTVYRVVQEGLTNARKHAPAAAVTVTVTNGASELAVRIVNRPSLSGPTTLPGSGSGLIGLTERVELAGGTLRHGTDPAGDFVLTATLPRTP